MMNRTTRSLEEVAFVRPLRLCGIEELAIDQYTRRPSGGVLFARKARSEEKSIARSGILALLDLEHYPNPISVLSMPGSYWKFEVNLMTLREGEAWGRKESPEKTSIVAVENDRALYHAALMKIPGIYAPGNMLRELPKTNFSERGFYHNWIDGYYFCNVDDLMRDALFKFDVAWLDYTGQLSINRMKIIRKYWEECISSMIVITSLKARWNRETSDAITRAGGLTNWILKYIGGGDVVLDYEYADGQSPMHQIAIRKRKPN